MIQTGAAHSTLKRFDPEGIAADHYPEEAVSFYAKRFIKVIAFVVPVLTGTCGFVAASIPPKGGTTNQPLAGGRAKANTSGIMPLHASSMGPLARERSFNVFVRGCERRRGYLVC